MSVSYRFLTLWITINLLDLKCSLILVLADVFFSTITDQIAFRKMQNHIIIINPIVVAQFFCITYITIIDYLLIFKKQNNLLKLIFHYYDIVEINGHSMF